MNKTTNVKSGRGDNLIWRGWRALHESALIYAAEVDYDSLMFPEFKGRSYLDDGIYEDLVFPLVGYCGIDISKFGFRSDLIGSLIWKRLRMKAIREESLVWKSILGEGSPISLMKNFDETKWSKNKTLIESGEPGELKSVEPRELKSIAKIASEIIRLRSPENVELAALLYGLALIGSIMTLLGDSVCAICFRRARPGRKFCSEHSQSQSDGSEPSKQYTKYRTGRKAMLRGIQKGKLEVLRGSKMSIYKCNLSWLAESIFDYQTFDPEIFSQFEHQSESTIQENWDQYVIDQKVITAQREKKHLFDILSTRCPLTLNLLGGDVVFSYTYENLLKTLRDKVDYHESSDQFWAGKIMACECWLKLEIEVAPGKRGGGRKTQLRINEAIKMAATGMNKIEIASALGVSPSAISKWLARKPELRGKL